MSEHNPFTGRRIRIGTETGAKGGSFLSIRDRETKERLTGISRIVITLDEDDIAIAEIHEKNGNVKRSYVEHIHCTLSGDPLRTRRLHITGTAKEMGYALWVRDADTGEEIQGVACAVLYLTPDKVNEAQLTYYVMDGQSRKIVSVDGEVLQHKAYVDNPEVDVVARERER